MSAYRRQTNCDTVAVYAAAAAAASLGRRVSLRTLPRSAVDTNFIHPFTGRPSVRRLKSTFPIWLKRLQSINEIFTSVAAFHGVCHC